MLQRLRSVILQGRGPCPSSAWLAPLHSPTSTPSPSGYGCSDGEAGHPGVCTQSKSDWPVIHRDPSNAECPEVSVCFEHKDHRSNIKNVHFQTEQEGLAGFRDMRPPRQPFQSLVLGGQEGQALNDPGCLQGT